MLSPYLKNQFTSDSVNAQITFILSKYSFLLRNIYLKYVTFSSLNIIDRKLEWLIDLFENKSDDLILYPFSAS